MSLNLTNTQGLAALAVLCRNIQPPFANANQTGIYVNNANQLVIPIASNSTIGTNLSNSADSNNVYLGLNMGDPASGV